MLNWMEDTLIPLLPVSSQVGQGKADHVVHPFQTNSHVPLRLRHPHTSASASFGCAELVEMEQQFTSMEQTTRCLLQPARDRPLTGWQYSGGKMQSA